MDLTSSTSFEALSRVREQMGAPLISWQSGVEIRERGREDILRRLRTQSGIELDEDLSGLATDTEGLFEYEGERVLLYIRDQWYSSGRPNQEYKFHVCKCSTISSMFQSNRRQRYVATKNTSGAFKVTVRYRSGEIKDEGMREMNVCKNCLSKLNYRGYRRSRSRRHQVYKTFSLSAFFREYGNTRFNEIPDHDEHSAPANMYPPNWEEISRSYRLRQGWVCEECGLDLSTTAHRRWLHTHHINHQRNECHDENLKALCIECHAEKPGHTDLRSSPTYDAFKKEYPMARARMR